MNTPSLYFYCNSNKPNNRPMNQSNPCDWGSYIIYKQSESNKFGVIIYIGDNFITRISFKNDTQSLTW